MRAAGGGYDPLPVDQAIAYIIEILPAFQYLHDLGLVYCDFKPDNIIQVGDAVKLIDLGGVRRIDDLDSADLRHRRLPGARGAAGRPVGGLRHLHDRAHPDGAGDGVPRLPEHVRRRRCRRSTETPLFQQHDSLYRLLAKACAPDPADRFASADELRVQLLGVLREVVAARDAEGGGRSTPTSSLLFESPTVTDDAARLAATCPALRVDDADPQAGWLRTVSVDDPGAAARRCCRRRRTLSRRGAAGHGAGRARGRAHRRGRRQPCATCSPTTRGSGARSGCPASPRSAADDAAGAQAAFNAVYGQVPGELAPKLALALACETGGEADVAESLYATCARTDANYIAPAAFGLARIRAGRGDVDGAVAALDLVPADQPRLHLGAAPAGRAAGRVGPAGCPPSPRRCGSIESLTIDPRRPGPPPRRRCCRRRCARCVEPTARTRQSPSPGAPPSEPALRDGLEAAYRDLAGHAPTRDGARATWSTGPTPYDGGRLR